MSKEDSTRTETGVVKPLVHASRDNEPADIVEDVVLEEIDATPKDEPDYEDALIDSEDPRNLIYAKHNKKRDEENAGSTVIDEENNDLTVETDDSAVIIEGEATPDPSEEMVEVKVYGDVRLYPKSRVDKAGGLQEFQKQLAVQEGMQRNADQAAQNQTRSDSLDERERRVVAQEAVVPSLDPQIGQSTPTDPPTGDQNLEEIARDYQEAVYEGDENAPSILVKMVAKAADSGEKFDKDEFRTQVKEEVLEDQRKVKVVKATKALIDNHPELNQRDTKFDPRMFTAVDDETSVVRRQHPEWEPDAVVQEAFSRVQKWRGGHKTSTMTDKQEAKREMNRPKVGTLRHTTPPPPPKKTRSDYVAEQRRLRGQDA